MREVCAAYYFCSGLWALFQLVAIISTTNVLRHTNRPFVRTCCCSFYVATTCEHGYTTTRLHGYSVLHATSVGVTIVAVHGGLQLFLACPFVRVLQLRHTRTIARVSPGSRHAHGTSGNAVTHTALTTRHAVVAIILRLHTQEPDSGLPDGEGEGGVWQHMRQHKEAAHIPALASGS